MGTDLEGEIIVFYIQLYIQLNATILHQMWLFFVGFQSENYGALLFNAYVHTFVIRKAENAVL